MRNPGARFIPAVCDELSTPLGRFAMLWESPVEARPDLNEIGYGKWEGQTREKVAREYHDEYVSWLADPAWHAPTAGELAITVATRSLRVIDEIKCQFKDGNVLIVSHKAIIRIILCSLLGIDVGRFRYRLGCPVGSVSVVEFSSKVHFCIHWLIALT